MIKNEKIGVVISTYNNPEWLRKVLWGYMYQTEKADEIVIADDGSDDKTRDMLKEFDGKLPIKHVWQEDEGFQKSRILNKAIAASESEYLIFTDQDCIPRRDFIETHKKYAEKGYFLSAGYFKLNKEISDEITEEDVKTGRAFSLKWLFKRGQKKTWKCTKLFGVEWFAKLMDKITVTNATWNGMNSSGWRENMIRINGFNEDMQYGGQDREFGERLWNLGIKDRGEVSRESINYDTLSTEELPNKTKLISVITSNKAFTKGHRERIEFVRKLKKHYGDRIDVYGRGFNGFEDKWDVLAPYKYHIAIENSSEKYYWTEKLSDCYLTGTFPIYYGCRNIGEYFDEKSYARIDINNFENAVKTIDEILGEDLYEQRRNALIESKRMVLDKYNIFEEIAWCCDRLNPEAEKKTIKLKPYKMEFSLKNFYSYAVSRNIQKLIYSLTKLS